MNSPTNNNGINPGCIRPEPYAVPGQLLEYILINADGDVIDRTRVHIDDFAFPAAYVKGMWENEVEHGAVIFTRVHPKLSQA